MFRRESGTDDFLSRESWADNWVWLSITISVALFILHIDQMIQGHKTVLVLNMSTNQTFTYNWICIIIILIHLSFLTPVTYISQKNREGGGKYFTKCSMTCTLQSRIPKKAADTLLLSLSPAVTMCAKSQLGCNWDIMNEKKVNILKLGTTDNTAADNCFVKSQKMRL